MLFGKERGGRKVAVFKRRQAIPSIQPRLQNEPRPLCRHNKMDAVNINFITEGQLTLNEVSFALKKGELSSSLPCNPDRVYMNIITQEGRRLCVCLDKHGFQVFDNIHYDVSIYLFILHLFYLSFCS